MCDQDIASIYDTVIQPDQWSSLLDHVAERAGAWGSLIFGIEEGTRLSVSQMSSRYDPEALQVYLDRYASQELQDQRAFLDKSLASDGLDILPDSFLYDDIKEFRARPHVQHVLNFGLCHRAAVLLNKDRKNEGRFSLQYADDRGGITEPEREYLRHILPHIAKALELGAAARKLQQNNLAFLSSFDRLRIGVAVLDGQGCLVERNLEFQRQAEDHGVFRVARSGQLLFADDDLQQQFDRLIGGPQRHGAFGGRPRKEAVGALTDPVLCIEVCPLHQAEELGNAALGGYFVTSTDTSRPLSVNALALSSALGLSPAETSLAVSLAEGASNQEIADQRNRSVATINSQVRSILAKTSCANRTQFARMIMGFGENLVGGGDGDG